MVRCAIFQSSENNNKKHISYALSSIAVIVVVFVVVVVAVIVAVALF